MSVYDVTSGKIWDTAVTKIWFGLKVSLSKYSRLTVRLLRVLRHLNSSFGSIYGGPSDYKKEIRSMRVLKFNLRLFGLGKHKG
jgi:hypothetical protein